MNEDYGVFLLVLPAYQTTAAPRLLTYLNTGESKILCASSKIKDEVLKDEVFKDVDSQLVKQTDQTKKVYSLKQGRSL